LDPGYRQHGLPQTGDGDDGGLKSLHFIVIQMADDLAYGGLPEMGHFVDHDLRRRL
jgi:hypothetical protein